MNSYSTPFLTDRVKNFIQINAEIYALKQKKIVPLRAQSFCLFLRGTFLLLVALPSAPPCLTAGFGMGPGVSMAISVPHVMDDSMKTKPNKSLFILIFKLPIFRPIYISNISPRTISIAHLNTSPCLQLQPIDVMVYNGSYSLAGWEDSS